MTEGFLQQCDKEFDRFRIVECGKGQIWRIDAKDFWHQKLQEARDKGYEKGFIDGCDTTGSQAEEVLGCKLHEQLDMVEKMIEEMPIEYVGNSAKTIDQILSKLQTLK